MSITGAKAQLKTAISGITWTLPSSASGIAYLTAKTQFGRVDDQQAGGGDVDVPESQFPYCRIHLPDGNEQRYTDGGDAASLKNQRIPAHLFIYNAGYSRDWQGLGDYFDTVVDATLGYFRRNGSPQPGLVSPSNNDHVVGWGLEQAWRAELPDLVNDFLVYRATVLVTIRMTIV